MPPIDVTEDFIHIRVLDPDQFETCRLTDFDGKLPKGVRAKYCKYADKDEWAVQAYIFEKAEGWDLEKAKQFVSTHKGFSLSYYASVSPREENGRKLVDIKIIDTTRNINNWRVTDQGLKRALNSLIGTPLLAYPDHSGTVMVGRFIDAQKPDGYAIGTAEITDPAAWNNIKSGRWKWVSPQVYAFDTREEDGTIVLNLFTFQHIAFVPNPAYPTTQVLNIPSDNQMLNNPPLLPTFSAALTSILGERRNIFSAYSKAPEDQEWDFNAADYTAEQLKRACAWYSGEDPENKGSYKLPHHLPDYGEFDKEVPEFHASFDGDASQFQDNGTAARPALEAGKNKKKGEEEKELSAEIATLQTKVTELETKNKTYEASMTKLETEKNTLKASLDVIAAERHGEKVNELLDLRAKAGLFEAAKIAEEETRLGKLTDAVLDQMIVDAKTFIKVLPKPSGPKATFTAEEQNSAEEQTRERLFGYKRDKDGKIVGGA